MRRPVTALTAAVPSPASSREGERLVERQPVRLGVRDEPRDRRVADPALRPVRDPHQADRIGGVVEHLEVGDRVLDLRALVEARAADHLVADLVQAQRLLEHPRLGVHPVEEGDLAAGVALLDEARRSGRRRSAPRPARPRPRRRGRGRRRRAPTRAASPSAPSCARSRRSPPRGSRSWSGSSARAGSSASRGSRARTRGCCGCRRRGRRRSTDPGRRRRRRCGGARRAAGATGTGRGSCPGTRRPSRSGRRSASASARPGSSPGSARSASACRRSRRRSRRPASSGRARRPRRSSGRRRSRSARRSAPA